jgi:hypothetical protein
LFPQLSTQALPFKIYGALIDVRGPATWLMLLQCQAFGLESFGIAIAHVTSYLRLSI